MKRLLAVLALTLSFTGLIGDAAAQQKIVIKFAHHAPVTYPYQDGAIRFKEVAERISGGRLEVQVFGGAQLGGERDLLEGIKLGTIHMCIGAGGLANFAPAYNVVQLPFLIKNQEHMVEDRGGPGRQAALPAHRGAGRLQGARLLQHRRQRHPDRQGPGAHARRSEGREDPGDGEPRADRVHARAGRQSDPAAVPGALHVDEAGRGRGRHHRLHRAVDHQGVRGGEVRDRARLPLPGRAAAGADLREVLREPARRGAAVDRPGRRGGLGLRALALQGPAGQGHRGSARQGHPVRQDGRGRVPRRP